MGTRQVQVKPSGQPEDQGTDQKGARPGRGMAMTQLETATMSLRQGLGPWGPMGRRCGGSRGGWAGPARSRGGTSYTYCDWILFCLETVCHADITGKESPTRNCQSDCFHVILKYPLKKNTYFKNVLDAAVVNICIHTHRSAMIWVQEVHSVWLLSSEDACFRCATWSSATERVTVP